MMDKLPDFVHGSGSTPDQSGRSLHEIISTAGFDESTAVARDWNIFYRYSNTVDIIDNGFSCYGVGG